MPKHEPTLTISVSYDPDGCTRLSFRRDGSGYERRYLEAEYGQAMRDIAAFFGLTPSPMVDES